MEARIRTFYDEHKGRYGYRRITAALCNAVAEPINHKCVQRLMRKMGLHASIRAKKSSRHVLGVSDGTAGADTVRRTGGQCVHRRSVSHQRLQCGNSSKGYAGVDSTAQERQAVKEAWVGQLCSMQPCERANGWGGVCGRSGVVITGTVWWSPRCLLQTLGRAGDGAHVCALGDGIACAGGAAQQLHATWVPDNGACVGARHGIAASEVGTISV
ncbi:MAG: transposase [Rickettsiales bacterium]|nr:transposase [Rickettsiales bacterium]